MKVSSVVFVARTLPFEGRRTGPETVRRGEAAGGDSEDSAQSPRLRLPGRGHLLTGHRHGAEHPVGTERGTNVSMELTILDGQGDVEASLKA